MSATAARAAEAAPGIFIFHNDLDDSAYEAALTRAVLSWDIETSGLDWRTNQIGTVQVQAGDTTYVVRPGRERPERLKALIEEPSLRKIFHHAMFDLRFISHHWNATPAGIACTKIASKLLTPDLPCSEHSLSKLLPRYVGVSVNKQLQQSDWTADHLAREQLAYAANDVRYLRSLYEELDVQLRQKGLADLRDRCYAHLPTRVQLELGAFPDVYAY